MTDPREPYALVALEALYAWAAEQPFGSAPWLHDWVDLSPPHQEALMCAAAAVARVAVAGERERAGAKLEEINFVIDAFFAHYGNSSAGIFAAARDLAEGIRQVIDRVPLGGGQDQERSDEKESGS